jgi:hypothetical protein
MCRLEAILTNATRTAACFETDHLFEQKTTEGTFIDKVECLLRQRILTSSCTVSAIAASVVSLEDRLDQQARHRVRVNLRIEALSLPICFSQDQWLPTKRNAVQQMQVHGRCSERDFMQRPRKCLLS